MSVVAEAISVVIPRAVVDERYPGGSTGYESACPNATFCADEHLTRVGFMAPNDVEAFVTGLAVHGLRFHDGEQFIDIAVIDQVHGLTAPAPWLAMEKAEEGYWEVWLAGSNRGELAVPFRWSPTNAEHLFLEEGLGFPDLRSIREGFDGIVDEEGTRRFVGRPFLSVQGAEYLVRKAALTDDPFALQSVRKLLEHTDDPRWHTLVVKSVRALSEFRAKAEPVWQGRDVWGALLPAPVVLDSLVNQVVNSSPAKVASVIEEHYLHRARTLHGEGLPDDYVLWHAPAYSQLLHRCAIEAAIAYLDQDLAEVFVEGLRAALTDQ